MTNVRKGQLCLCTKPETSASSPFVSPHVGVRVYVLYLFSLPCDFVVKADDDTYFRLPKLIESLKKKMPREDLYYGFVIPCDSMDPFHEYMSGMGYLLSWDLAEWIPTSEVAKNNAAGPEDMMTGKWLREGKKGKNRYNTKYAMYDYPIDACSHEFVPDTIAVHRLKDNLKWARTLEYLNATDSLKPSKFVPHRLSVPYNFIV